MTFTPPPCTIGEIRFDAGGGIGGRDVYRALCACGITFWGWTADHVQAEFNQHREIPAPPAEVLQRPITFDDVQMYPHYFISGPGRALADQTNCEHGYLLTASCPNCP